MSEGLLCSPYVIVSKSLFVKDGEEYRIIFNTENGALKAVQPTVLDKCKHRDQFAQINENEQLRLISLGLRPLSAKERLGLKAKVLDRLRSHSNDRSTARIIIMPTSQCNLKCGYCGQSHQPGVISRTAEDAILQRIRAKAAHPETKAIGVTWFGGEPILGIASMLRISKGISEIAAERGVYWSSKMPTNGVLLGPEKIRALYDIAMLRHIEVTIDGIAPIHDESRPVKRGPARNFDQIISNLSYIATSDEYPDFSVSIRINVHQNSIEYVPLLLEELSGQGFVDKRFSVKVVPVYDWGADNADGKLDRESFAFWEIGIYSRMRELGLRFGLLPLHVVPNTCTATDKLTEVVSPNGRLFTCTEEVLVKGMDPERSVGTIFSQDGVAERRTGRYDDWVDQIEKKSVSPCFDCGLLPLCGGACPKQWMEGRVFCPPYRYNMPERLDWIAVAMGFELANQDFHG